jgi:uncharacterized membrane protein YgdD (TMEM256/DUF423 family)
MKTQLIIATILGFLGVAIGAIGAHALKNILQSVGKIEQFETANRYHWYHLFAIIACFVLNKLFPNELFVWSNWFFIAGIVLFSGSLYAYSLTGTKIFAHITPFGGLMYLVAWVLAAVAVVKSVV